MTRDELKDIIKECTNEILNEGLNDNTMEKLNQESEQLAKELSSKLDIKCKFYRITKSKMMKNNGEVLVLSIDGNKEGKAGYKKWKKIEEIVHKEWSKLCNKYSDIDCISTEHNDDISYIKCYIEF